MNIFITSHIPRRAAADLDDKRVVKMVLEAAQLLSCAMADDGPYKLTHQNHPCAVWAHESAHNADWLYEWYVALCQEYTARYGEMHKCEEHKLLFLKAREGGNWKEHTPFVHCSPYKNIADVQTAYRRTMMRKWKEDKRCPTWYGDTRATPGWCLEYIPDMRDD